jgi:hypothetical protein
VSDEGWTATDQQALRTHIGKCECGTCATLRRLLDAYEGLLKERERLTGEVERRERAIYETRLLLESMLGAGFLEDEGLEGVHLADLARRVAKDYANVAEKGGAARAENARLRAALERIREGPDSWPEEWEWSDLPVCQAAIAAHALDPDSHPDPGEP